MKLGVGTKPGKKKVAFFQGKSGLFRGQKDCFYLHYSDARLIGENEAVGICMSGRGLCCTNGV